MLEPLKRPSLQHVLDSCEKITRRHVSEGTSSAASISAGKGDPDAILRDLRDEERTRTYCLRKLERAEKRGDRDRVATARTEAESDPQIKSQDNDLQKLAKYAQYFAGRDHARAEIRPALTRLDFSRYSQVSRIKNGVRSGTVKLGRWIKDHRVVGGGSTAAAVILLKLAIVILIADKLGGGHHGKTPPPTDVGGPGALINNTPLPLPGFLNPAPNGAS